jgi:RNA polymerase sigma-70 factor, ECF subfamily
MSDSSTGQRLIAFEPRLRLLLTHLASPAVSARVTVDDFVQEVYLRALRTGALPEDGTELFRYLAAIARHSVVDAVRAIRAKKRAAPELALVRSDWSAFGMKVDDLAAETMGPATRAQQAEATQQLHAAFASLDPDHRRVVGLRQLEGLSARETAIRMGRTETAVHSLYRRALMAWEAAAGGDFAE